MMKAPVVHADGTITVLLESDGNKYNQTELIRLDRLSKKVATSGLF